MTLATARSSSAGSATTSGRRRPGRRTRRRTRRPTGSRAPRTPPPRRRPARSRTPSIPAWRRPMSRRLADDRVQAVRLGVDRLAERPHLARRPLDVLAEQARRGRLDVGQRRRAGRGRPRPAAPRARCSPRRAGGRRAASACSRSVVCASRSWATNADSSRRSSAGSDGPDTTSIAPLAELGRVATRVVGRRRHRLAGDASTRQPSGVGARTATASRRGRCELGRRSRCSASSSSSAVTDASSASASVSA